MSQTPSFDKAINEILSGLAPHQKTCPQCLSHRSAGGAKADGAVFEIFAEDIEFYKMFKVPQPALCPNCRLQRRLGHRLNWTPVFYKKICSAPGHQEKLISIYSEQNPVMVFDDDYYFSDQWDSLVCGREYDFGHSFFEQFQALSLAAPHLVIHRDVRNISCDYTTGGTSGRNCYFVGVPYNSEDVFYSSLPSHCKDCLDVFESDYCEKCYEAVYAENCYDCNFCHECLNCLNSDFLYGCRNCSHCFGCTNLRNKQYHFFNQPLSKEDYEQKVKEINLGSRKVLLDYQAQFAKLLQGVVRRGVYNLKIERSFGDLLRNCRNAFYCFRVLGGPSDNLRYMVSVDKASDSMDITGGAGLSLCYESGGIVTSSKIKFSIRMRGNNLETEYCYECSDCEHCFGCFGLRNKKFCVFNRQFNELDYWQLVDKIKTEMLKKGEYGEFFPLSISPFAYQDSDAPMEFPLSKEEIIKNNWHWQDEVKSDIDLTKFEVLKASEVADDITEVSDDILNKVIICGQTGKPFRIMPFELSFYRRKKLPLPIIHPLQRMKNRFAFRRHFRLWQVPCANCGKTTPTSFDPKDNFKVYCEDCYLKEIV